MPRKYALESCLRPRRWVASAAVLILPWLAACGGGNDDAPKTEDKAAVKSRLMQCPVGTQSPVDMGKLSCLVGNVAGKVYDLKNPDKPVATNQDCTLRISADGTVNLETKGGASYVHKLSAQSLKRDYASGSMYSRSKADADGMVYSAEPGGAAAIQFGVSDTISPGKWILAFFGFRNTASVAQALASEAGEDPIPDVNCLALLE